MSEQTKLEIRLAELQERIEALEHYVLMTVPTTSQAKRAADRIRRNTIRRSLQGKQDDQVIDRSL